MDYVRDFSWSSTCSVTISIYSINTDACEALGEGIDFIFAMLFVALAMSFVCCKSSVVVRLVSEASLNAWFVL